MVSDYFVLTSAEKKKLGNDETKVIAEVQRRIKELKDYIIEFFEKSINHTAEYHVHATMKYSGPLSGTYCVGTDTQENWVSACVLDIGTNLPTRMFISRAYFDKLAAQWTQEHRIKIDEQDWRYLIYQLYKDDGAVWLSWADCTLSICMDIPPIISEQII